MSARHEYIADDPLAMKRCPRCRSHKLTTEFSKNRRRGDGLQYHCKKCCGELAKLRASDRRAGYRTAHYRIKKYGVDEETFDAMVESQGGGCAICGRKPEDFVGDRFRTLCVDHDHNTGVIRGVLCQRCNRGLGMFDDDPGRMKTAAKYLRESGSNF